MSVGVTFADGVGSVGYVSNTLRIELVQFDAASSPDDTQPKRSPCHKLVLTDAAFMELLTALHQTHQRLLNMRGENAGKGGDPEKAVGTQPDSAEKSVPVSPNFPEV